MILYIEDIQKHQQMHQIYISWFLQHFTVCIKSCGRPNDGNAAVKLSSANLRHTDVTGVWLNSNLTFCTP